MGRLWTPEQDAQLRQLRADGMTFTQIGAVMLITRCSALGRAGRLGLSSPDRQFRSRAVPKSPRVSAKAPWPEELTPVLNLCDPLPLEDLGKSQCQYAVNDGLPFMFCTMPRERGVYCLRHWTIAHTKVMGRPVGTGKAA